MEIDNKVASDLYRVTSDLVMSKNVTSNVDSLNPSAMINKLRNVRSLSELDESKINKLLHATDEI